ncbi:MAG: AmpG family muropeptide MFS transporter [Gammaproteobacteria bacterium]|nr:AmpG family muropeptide MFS transporter [Gammaproteobacteria bacterium]MDH5617352.1 AmpG family muropeptide MFS transporter [Gammaproteobacteria bacterium]
MTADANLDRARKESLKEAVLNRRMLICVFTGFASGLPLYMLFQMVPYWLRTEGVGLAEIGFFALVQFPYTWKFVWAPIMDRYTLPFLGHRRGWILLTQVLLLIAISTMGFFKPAMSLWTIAYLATAVAFFSASQDIVLDAYRRELLPDVELGLGNSIHVQAYRLSGLIPGGLALILADHLPWHLVFVVVALFMLVGIVMTLVIDEAIKEPSPPRSLMESVIEPFREFVGRSGLGSALLVLAFLFFYKLGDNMATALQTPFFHDVGFSGTQIGTIAKLVGTTAAIVGGLIGGLIMVKVSINRALWLFGFVQITSILGFALLSVIGANPWMLAFAMAFEYLGVGLGTAALTAFMAKSTNVAFAATQFALFTALISVPRVLASATTGLIVEVTGWTNFFLVCTLLAIPGMLLLLKVAPWNEDSA